MLFSILIPVYNAEKYFDKCLQSVLDQAIDDYEVVLCDDCSTDRSGILCDQYAERYPDRVRAVHNSKNCGLLSTRRKLYGLAKGEWVLCVDADDLLMEGALVTLRNSIKTESPDMIIFDMDCFHTNGTVEHFRPALTPNEMYQGERKSEVYAAIYKNRYLNSLCSKVYRRSFIDLDTDYAEYSKLQIGEDLFQSYPLFDRAEKIYYLHEALYAYRKNENSMTHSLRYDFYEIRKPLWNRENFYWNKWKLSGDTLQLANNRRIREIIGYLRNQLAKNRKTQVRCLAEKIIADGYLKEALRQGKPNLKYATYAKLILSKHICVFSFLSNIEQRLSLALIKNNVL